MATVGDDDPDPADLDCLTAMGRPHSLITAAVLPRWARGVAPISRMPIGNHCLIRTAVVADHADMPPIARALMRETARPLPDGLQSAWAAQRTPCGSSGSITPAR